MAFLIPENLRNNKAIPRHHRRVGSALAVGLDDEATVWFEPMFDPDLERPDFVVLDPSVGVIVVMVFDQDDGQEVLGAVRGSLRVVDGGDERTTTNPLERANQFGRSLQAAIAADSSVSRVPVGGIAAFPYVSRRHVEQLGMDAVVSPDHCLFKDDIDTIVRGDGGSQLARILTHALDGGVGEALTDGEVDHLRGLIHPEVVIAAAPEQPSLFVAPAATRPELFRVMDRKQERFAKGLGSGHRVIRGVAGSGKTLILVARARLLSRLLPGQRILVTCFTRALAGVLRSQLADCDNVEVVHIDALMARAIKAAGIDFPGYSNEALFDSTALEALALVPPERYRSVLVDEAQDLSTDRLRFCVALTETDEEGEGDLLVVADSAQNIFRRQFNWSDAGIKAQGRTNVLRTNYRNTREILQFAQAFLTADADTELDELPDLDDDAAVIPADAAERSGPEPEIETVTGFEAELERVIGLVSDAYRADLPARSIAVLMADQRGDDRAARIVQALGERELPVYWVTDPKGKDNKDQAGLIDEPIIVSTVHSAKGLEFPQVIMCGLGGGSTGDIGARKRVYVGMTRALDDLRVVVRSDNVFAADLPPG